VLIFWGLGGGRWAKASSNDVQLAQKKVRENVKAEKIEPRVI